MKVMLFIPEDLKKHKNRNSNRCEIFMFEGVVYYTKKGSTSTGNDFVKTTK